MKHLFNLVAISLLAIASDALAFTYQGELTQTGAPFTGNADIEFSLYDAASGGVMVGSSDLMTSVAVSNGRFAVELGQWATFLDGTPLWLEIAASVPAGGGLTILTPRQNLSPAPYAEYAYDSANAGGVSPWTESGGNVYRSSGRVGIGTSTPGSLLHIQGNGSGNELRLYGVTNVPTIHFRDTGGNNRDWVMRHDDSRFHIQTEASNGSEILTLTADQRVGVRTISPLVPLHVEANSIGVNAAHLQNEGILLAQNDAVLGLFSGGGGTFGSAISLAEVDAGALVDKWAISRQTSAAGSNLTISYGQNANYSDDTVKPMVLTNGGRVGIGTDTPIAVLSVDTSGTEAPLSVKVNGNPSITVGGSGYTFVDQGMSVANGLYVSDGILTPTRTGYLTLNGRGFRNDDSSLSENPVMGRRCTNLISSCLLFHSVVLPDHSVLTNFQMIASDNTVNYTIATFSRVPFGVPAQSRDDVVAVFSPRSGNLELAEENVFLSDATTDNQNFSYYVSVSLSTGSILHSVRLTYTTTIIE